MTQKHCTTCGMIHRFNTPKYRRGQSVRVIDSGFNHNDKIGAVTVITEINTMLSDPCDQVEYNTELGFGSISEHRLEAVE